MTNHRNRYSMTPEKLDTFLFRKYGHGLYPFCYALAHIICLSDPRYSDAPEDLPPILRKGHAKKYKQIRGSIKRKESLKKRIIEVFAKDLKAMGASKEGKIFEAEIEYIKNIYPGVSPLLQTIDRQIDFDKRWLLGKSLWRKKGHPTDNRNKVAFVFAQVIKKEGGEPDWKVIRSLLVWLWKYIKKATYSCELAFECPVFTPETLRSAYFKFIKNPERKSDIEDQAAHCFKKEFAFSERAEFPLRSLNLPS